MARNFSQVTTNDAIYNALCTLSDASTQTCFDAATIREQIVKIHGKKEEIGTVRRQLARMTNEDARKFPWVKRVGVGLYAYNDQTPKVFAEYASKIESHVPSVLEASTDTLIKELKNRLPSVTITL